MQTPTAKKGKIETYDELLQIGFGNFIWIVENNDVRKYYICCEYPFTGVKSVLITYGTNNECSKWIGEHWVSTGKIYNNYNDAVQTLITDMESDLEAVKRLYIKD